MQTTRNARLIAVMSAGRDVHSSDSPWLRMPSVRTTPLRARVRARLLLVAQHKCTERPVPPYFKFTGLAAARVHGARRAVAGTRRAVARGQRPDSSVQRWTAVRSRVSQPVPFARPAYGREAASRLVMAAAVIRAR